MIMADIFFWIAVALGVMATIVGHWLTAQALFPGTVARCAEAYARRPVASAVYGVLIGVPSSVVLLTLIDKLPHPVLKIAAIGLLGLILIVAFIGSAGLARRTGLGLAGESAPPTAPATPVLRGGIVLVLTFLAPVLGWFILMPLVLASGLGAWLLGRRLDV